MRGIYEPLQEFCTLSGAYGSHYRNQACGSMGPEWGGQKEHGRCHFNACNRHQAIHGKCCEQNHFCCGIGGRGERSRMPENRISRRLCGLLSPQQLVHSDQRRKAMSGRERNDLFRRKERTSQHEVHRQHDMLARFDGSLSGKERTRTAHGGQVDGLVFQRVHVFHGKGDQHRF